MSRTKSKKVILTDSDRFPLEGELLFRLSTQNIQLTGLNYGISEKDLIGACREVDGVIVFGTKFTRKVIEQMNHCRIQARCGIGIEVSSPNTLCIYSNPL